ncbi:MAG: efflux RND transporter periplasmic adaptor subunit [Bacteroidota bacterium]
MRKSAIFSGIFLLMLAAMSCQEESNTAEQAEQSEGTASSIVALDTGKLQMDDIELFTTGNHNIRLSRAVPGVAMGAPNYVSVVAAPLSGIVSKLHLNEGERVRKGQVIMEIESIEYGNLLSDFMKAVSELSYQNGRLERTKQLTERGVAPESELEAVKAESDRARANQQAVKARLMALGVSEAEIHQMKDADNIEPHLFIRSKISGVIDQHQVELGMPVQAYDELATVVNTEKVLVKAWLSPEDLNYISPGDSVSISRRTSPGVESINSIIASINPALDQDNQSVIANIYVKTVNNWPVPGENVRVELSSDMPNGLIAVPSDAITYLGNKEVIFVRAGDNQFQVREIEVSHADSDNSFVRQGLDIGEKVAVSEVFTLKSMLRFNQFAE